MEGLENSSPFVAINFNIFIKPISSVVIKKFHMLTLVFTEKSNVSVCLLAQKTVHLGISFFFFILVFHGIRINMYMLCAC